MPCVFEAHSLIRLDRAVEILSGEIYGLAGKIDDLTAFHYQSKSETSALPVNEAGEHRALSCLGISNECEELRASKHR